MDSSSDEDEDEFFETLEDIPSSSDAESGGEEKRNLDESTGSKDIASNGQMRSQISVSRYEIWKSNPGSIPERRQRLLSQMGLKLETEDPDNTVVLLDASPRVAEPSTTSSTLQTLLSQTEANANFLVPGGSASQDSTSLGIRKDQVAEAREGRWTMVRSRSDGTFPRLHSGDSTESCSGRLVKSGTTSPLLPHNGHDRLADGSGAVLRTGSSGHGHPSSKPPLGGKKASGTGPSIPISRSFTEGLAARRFKAYRTSSETAKFTDRNGEFNNETPQTLLKNGRLAVQSSEDAENLADGEILCRIKDLDSGKEFVVNEVGKDGLWNKLKELDTGRELTLEEFETSLGLSPIVQEVMRRARATEDTGVRDIRLDTGPGAQKKKRGWLKVIKGVVRGSQEKGNHGSGSDEKEGSTEKSGRKSGSATDDSQDIPQQTIKRIKVHTHRKATKEFSELHLRQEIQAHHGAIWTMKFSLDGSYLATAGQDRIVKVWEVFEQNERTRRSPDTSGELNAGIEKSPLDSPPERQKDMKKSGKSLSGRKKGPSSTSQLPKLFFLSQISKCEFKGHSEDILDLSWSPSQSLLSSSLDKTVRLWNVASRECLKIFAHNDYVTCIQFNPVDDGYFISGSLDGKVRIWSIQERQVVDWADLREMVTAACYTPYGQGAVVGSYKGTCRFYKTSGNKLQLDTTFEVRNKSKRSQGKKITGFQFIPGDEDKVLITSSDSRIRVYNGTEISSKYKGFRNTNSQISASFTSDGRYIISASEDSRVYIWNYHNSNFGHPKGKAGSYEDFSARHVLVAIPWPGMGLQPTKANFGETKLSKNSDLPLACKESPNISEIKVVNGETPPVSEHLDHGIDFSCQVSPCEAKSVSDGVSNLANHENGREVMPTGLQDSSRMGMLSPECHRAGCLGNDKPSSSFSGGISFTSCSLSDCYLEGCSGSSIFSKGAPMQQVGNHGFFSDSKGSATWPEEKLPPVQQTPNINMVDNLRTSDTDEGRIEKNTYAMASAWGLVIVTAGLEGEIRAFQNYSLPVRL